MGKKSNFSSMQAVTMSMIFWVLLVIALFAASFAAWKLIMSGKDSGTALESSPILVAQSGQTQTQPAISPAFDREARAFIIAKHENHGYLILTGFKQRKGAHGQLPGGRIDRGEDSASAAKREFFEETGILVDKNRLKPIFAIGSKNFFLLTITDADQVKGGSTPETGEPFRLKLSDEHINYAFYKDIHAASKAVLRHSGGDSAEALEKLAGTPDFV